MQALNDLVTAAIQLAGTEGWAPLPTRAPGEGK